MNVKFTLSEYVHLSPYLPLVYLIDLVFGNMFKH